MAWSCYANPYDVVYSIYHVHLEHKTLLSFQKSQSSEKPNFFCFRTNKYRSKCPSVFSFIGSLRSFLYPKWANCLNLYCLEQSYWVARSWVILGSSKWISFSELIPMAITSKEKLLIQKKIRKFRKVVLHFKPETGSKNLNFQFDDQMEVRQWK